jgi:hypothetical protein
VCYNSHILEIVISPGRCVLFEPVKRSLTMADKPRDDAHALYLPRKNGWFWVVPEGQKSIYYGPYASKHAAEFYGEDVDTYRYDGGIEEEA